MQFMFNFIGMSQNDIVFVPQTFPEAWIWIKLSMLTSTH